MISCDFLLAQLSGLTLHLNHSSPQLWRLATEADAYSVGFHADQLTNLGPYPTIASLSLGVPRAFRLRPTASELDSGPVRTYEVDLTHNSLVLMTAGCQERYKHT